MLRARIRRLHPGVPLPRYETRGSAGFDLAASRDMSIEPGDVALVPTGLVIEVPAGYFLAVFARSSTPLKRGLMVANGVGVIDQDYCGPEDEVKVEVYNFTPRPVSLKAGDRIAQGLFIPVGQAEWQEVDVIREDSRGGFGATDKGHRRTRKNTEKGHGRTRKNTEKGHGKTQKNTEKGSGR